MRRLGILVAGLLLGVAACGRLGFAPAGEPGGADARGDGTADGDGAVGGDDAPPDTLAAGTWAATTPLPSAREMACAVHYLGRIYVLGGATATAELTETLMANILPDGTLGAWNTTTPLPYAVRWHACAVSDSARALYVVGGDAGDVPKTGVLAAGFAGDGTLAGWTVQPDLPGPRRGLGAIATNGVLYALGGESMDGFNLNSTVFQASIATNGDLSAGWTTATAMPSQDYMFGTAAFNGRVYTSGGYTSHSKVRSAPLGGAFRDEVAMPGPRERHASVQLGGYIYAIGGEPSFQAQNLTSVVRAHMQADGTLDPWEDMPPLPTKNAYLSATSDGHRIYVLGGSDDTSLLDVAWVFTPP